MDNEKMKTVLSNSNKIQKRIQNRIPGKIKHLITDEEVSCLSVKIAELTMALSDDFINYLLDNMIIEMTNRNLTNVFIDMKEAKENISNVEEEAFYNIINSNILER